MMEMQISTFFNPNLTWDEQLAPLMGEEEVEKLKGKFVEMNMKNLDAIRVSFVSMFPCPPPHSEIRFFHLMKEIGSWPMVDSKLLVILSFYLLSAGCYRVSAAIPHNALLPRYARPGRQNSGVHPTEICTTASEIPQ